jgi:uncharacterized RDD family membrane protein YckC/DNA-binding transcriptional ArsR family regulator
VFETQIHRSDPADRSRRLCDRRRLVTEIGISVFCSGEACQVTFRNSVTLIYAILHTEIACFSLAADQDKVSKILSVLSHPLRRQILLYLSEKQECSFTDFATAFSVDTGRLSFHLRSLEAFVTQPPNGKYRLSRVGENAILLIKDLEAWAAEAEIAKRASIRPLASWKKRSVAFVLDFLIAGAIFIAMPNILYPFTLELIFINVNIIFFLVLFWAYLTLLEGFAGQSLGKLLMRLKVLRTDGKNVLYDRAAVRNFGKVFLLPVDLVVGWRLNDKRYLRYFDKFAGTVVVDLDPKAAKPPENVSTQEQIVDVKSPVEPVS